MKKFISVILIAIFVITTTSSCGGGKSNRLEGDLKDIVAKVNESNDLSFVNFTYSTDEGAEDILFYIYGVEEDKSSLLEDYVISERGDSKAASFAIFRFKDGSGADLEAFKDAIQYYYVEGMYSLFNLYIPEEYEIAKGATYKIYDNAVVLAVYDTSGNNTIFDIVNTFAK